MYLDLKVKELTKYFGVNQDTIINWQLRSAKPKRKNWKKAKGFPEMNG